VFAYQLSLAFLLLLAALFVTLFINQVPWAIAAVIAVSTASVFLRFRFAPLSTRGPGIVSLLFVAGVILTVGLQTLSPRDWIHCINF
jgi:hypothetical protein